MKITTQLLSIVLLSLLIFPTPLFAQEATAPDSDNLIPVFFFSHDIDDVPVGILALAPLFATEDENGDYFERWLTAYYKLNGDLTDSSANSLTLTRSGDPAFTSTVPFAGGSSSDAYSYAGTNYANPHAPTTISGTTLTYDNNGNLTAFGTTTYSYDYRNRLTQSALNNSTTTYAYDDLNNRTRQTIGSTTTWYPNKFFSKTAMRTGGVVS